MRFAKLCIVGLALFLPLFLQGGARAQSADPDAEAKLATDVAAALKRYNLHGQTTVIPQGTPPFPSPYEGENSLDPLGDARVTWTVTLAAGLRLEKDHELYFNPEMFEGFGLSRTHGVAGFPNGEAQKGGSFAPEFYIARLFYRYTFGLGGDTETLKDDFNQLPGTRDVSRVTFTLGKMAVVDLFDDNTYAHDPRTTFFNWSIWEAAAFDYAADQKGYTVGAALDINEKDWALRFGYYLEPIHSNAQTLDWQLFQRGQYIGELEQRYKLNSQPGKLRWLAWLGLANAGSYAESLALTAQTGADPNETILATRETRVRYGFVAGLEQALSDKVGLFARLSWADGQSEVMSFTDIDSSASGGIVLDGALWAHHDHRIGIGGAVNAISQPHRQWIGAGGLGLLIGDGKLNYSTERILETYYLLPLCAPVFLTLDYQFIDNPGYNSDRGPVSAFAARLHAQY